MGLKVGPRLRENPALPCMAVAYHFCLALPEKFSQPGNRSFAGPCTYLGTLERHRPALFNVNGGHPLLVFLILRSAYGGILLAGNVQSGRLGRSRLIEDKVLVLYE